MKLSIGAAQFGLDYGVTNTSGCVSEEDVRAILNLANRFNVDVIDTAIAYGCSESVLGKMGLCSWKVITKLPALPEGEKNISSWVVGQISDSLQRLNMDKLHGLLLHRPSQLLEKSGAELYSALQLLKSEGLVSKIGISIYETSELNALCGRYVFDLVQAPVNILDRRFVRTGWANRLKNEGVEIHARSVFLQGLLLAKKNNRPLKFNRWSPVWKKWDDWLSVMSLTPLEACLRYVNQLEDIDKFIVGVTSPFELQEILDALKGGLDQLPEFGNLLDDELINPAHWGSL